MDIFYFIFHTTRQTLKAEKLLRAEDLAFETLPLPAHVVSGGCSMCLAVPIEQKDKAINTCIVGKIPLLYLYNSSWQMQPIPTRVKHKIYLDYNATTPIAPEVADAMLPFIRNQFGNPSSLHEPGRLSRNAIEHAREQVAKLINADSDEIIFTSGGTESNNAALIGVAMAQKHKGRHIITSAIEHKSVLNCLHFLEQQGFSVTHLPVDSNGVLDATTLRTAIQPDTILISTMFANNETGAVQPVDEIAAIAREQGIVFHTDAIQAAGKCMLDVQRLGCSLLSISAHKLYGPKGVGALYIRKATPFVPFLYGGKQENGQRAGTENVPGIVGFGKAAELAGAQLDHCQDVRKQRDLLERQLLQIPSAIVHAQGAARLANTLSIAFPGIEAESLVIQLDMHGIYTSTGSACNSGDIKPSHVLKAMGVSDKLAKASIRFSLGRFTTAQEINIGSKIVLKIVKQLRKKQKSLIAD